MRRELWFIFAILIAVFLFFPELFFLKVSFLSGDHRAQHYPWDSFLAESIKQGRLPWWTSYFHCGFPLIAEGQVGAFYPLNLLFFYLLPMFAAYTYEILAHYVLGGLLFYGYLRSQKLSDWSSFFGTLVYLFGCAQGGYYYNIISQRVLIWLPLTFYLSDRIIERGEKRCLWWLALVFAFQIFGGYLQYAVYSIGFSAFYFVWFSVRKAKKSGEPFLAVRDLCLLGISLLVAAVIALPQLGSTAELAGFSNRFSYPEEFAYVGSMNPLALATIFFPHWDGFLRTEIYLGAVSLFFLLASLLMKKGEREIFFLVMGLCALALALGKFNPLFVLLIKASGFSGFRVPSKFIYFAAAAFSVLCAYGFEKWLHGVGNERGMGTVRKVFILVSSLGLGGFFAVNFILRKYEPGIRSLLAQYVEKHFVGSKVHMLPLEEYLRRLETYYAQILEQIAPFNFWSISFLGFIALAVLLVHFAGRRRGIKKHMAALAFSILAFLNFYLYSYTTVKGNYENYSFVDQPSGVVDYLKENSGLTRFHRLLTHRENADRLVLVPHTNMIYKLATTNAYSPFVLAEYYELMRGLGGVNDSHRLLDARADAVEQDRQLLNSLNVKHVLSDTVLEGSGLRKVLEEDGAFLYENYDVLPRAYFVATDEKALVPGEFFPELKKEQVKPVEILRYGEEEVSLKVDAPAAGYLVLSDLYYPGWKARVDGRAAEIFKINGILRALRIQHPGTSRADFYYDPLWKKLTPLTLLLSLFCVVFPMTVSRQRVALRR